MSRRPPFIVSTEEVPETPPRSYPESNEMFAVGRPIGRAAGLIRIGLHVERVEPGRRTSWPHAEEDEKEFVYVLEGEIDAWIDGDLYRMKAGDLAAFSAGTGINHTFINNNRAEAKLLVGGESWKPNNRCYFPLKAERRDRLAVERWAEAPARKLGPHDALPNAVRKQVR
jgi:uncharacterized cupin superfamily protein